MVPFVQDTYVQATFVYIDIISAVTDPILTKLLGPTKNFWTPDFSLPKSFSDLNFFWHNIFFQTLNLFWTQHLLGTNIFWGPNILGSFFFTQYCFWTQKIFSDTNENFWILNFLLNPNFLEQIFLETKFFNTKSFFFDPNFYFKYYISVFGGAWGVLTNMLKLLTLWRGLGGSKPKWWHADTFKAREGWESWNIEQVLL